MAEMPPTQTPSAHRHAPAEHDEVARLRRELAQVARQLAEREQEVEQLKSGADQLRLLIEGSKRFFFAGTLDMRTIHYVSPVYESIWGRSCESLYANPVSWLEGVHPEDRPRVMAVVARRVRENQGLPPEPGEPPDPEFNDYRVIRPDGTQRWVRGRSWAFREAPNMIFGVAEDVTEFKERELAAQSDRATFESQAAVWKAELEQMSGWLVREAGQRLRMEDSLRESEELYRLLAENSSDMITKHNREGVFIYASPASRDLLGYKPDELLGKNPYEMFHPEDIEIVRESHEKIMSQPDVNTVSYRMRRRDGSYTWLETTTKMIHDPAAKEFGNIICVSRDVTKRKETEARVELLQHQLADASRVSLLGALAKGLAHELNQPLTAIGNYLESCRNFLKEVPDVPEGARAVLTEAGDEALRAAKVIQSLRKLVRPSQAQHVRSNLNDLVTEVMEICAPHLRRGGVTLDLQLEPELPMLQIDPVQIQQVILNLVNNAIDSMSTSDQPRHLTVVTSRPSPDRVGVTVLDTGPGCPDGDVEGLFTEFRTTKPSGLGLGLAICRYIIEAHGGTLTGRPRVEGGLAFSFTLPYET